ncbi:hypothetical protein [uncultured Thiocystis sp.]|uniref:hypothetical protein n=1 Tax=uncultured Thiocystis sp. TaxID=1202134 RepID=UPI0025F0540B|nr:hypothetical protein [uncultured Thiocystis sp.]
MVQIAKQIVDQGCFSRAWFARDDDESFAVSQGILKIRLCFGETAVLKTEAGIRTEPEGIVGKTVILCIHGSLRGCP